MTPVASQDQQLPDLKGGKNGTAKSTSPGSATASSATKKRLDSYRQIRDFLELYYIRHRPDMEARDLIYGRDASGGLSIFSLLALSRIAWAPGVGSENLGR